MRLLLLPLLLLTLTGADCGPSHIVVSVIGDSHSDDNRDPRADWLPWAPRPWVIDDHSRQGNKCWQAIPRSWPSPKPSSAGSS